jgi:hypothetical protein
VRKVNMAEGCTKATAVDPSEQQPPALRRTP